MDIKEIIEAVARCYDTSVSDILSSSRDEKTITARHVAIYLAHTCLPMSLREIAKAFNRTHATILFAERKVRERMSEDDVFRSEVEQLRRKIEVAEQPKIGETTSKACDARRKWLSNSSRQSPVRLGPVSSTGLGFPCLHRLTTTARRGSR